MQRDRLYLLERGLDAAQLLPPHGDRIPVENATLRRQVIEQGLDAHWRDNELAWDMQPDGRWKPCLFEGDRRRSSHQELLEKLAAGFDDEEPGAESEP